MHEITRTLVKDLLILSIRQKIKIFFRTWSLLGCLSDGTQMAGEDMFQIHPRDVKLFAHIYLHSREVLSNSQRRCLFCLLDLLACTTLIFLL